MNATIVKNDDFKTVGFDVISNGVTLFSWGISSSSPFFFTKSVSVEKWLPQIFELVKLQAVVHEQECFCSQFFDVAFKNKLLKKGQGVILGDEERIEATKSKMENIINKII